MDGTRLRSTGFEEPQSLPFPLQDRRAAPVDLSEASASPKPIQKRWPMFSRRIGEASPLARTPDG